MAFLKIRLSIENIRANIAWPDVICILLGQIQIKRRIGS
jgi:hypothetical protein